MHVINVHYACDTPVTRSAGPCDCPDLPGRSPAALQAPTDQFNSMHNVTKVANEQMVSGTAREMAYVFAMDFLPAFHRMTVALAPCGALAVRGPVMMPR